MSFSFPNQAIPQIEKTPAWSRRCVDYGLSLLDFQSRERSNDNRWYRSYNGIRTPESLAWITKVYGKEARAKFVTYNPGRAKQNLLDGEWNRRPLNSTVETINIQAKSDKMDQMDLMTGAMLAKDEIQTLKEVAGVDVMEGAPVPQSEDDPLWDKMSPKDKQEDIMQVIINEQKKALKVKHKFGKMFRDARIVGKCFAKVEIDENGEVDLIWIDPRDAIYEEIDGDDFLKKSTIKGSRQCMPIHEILMKFTLTPEDRKKIEAVRDTPNNYIGDQRYRIRMVNQQCMVDVIHVEWKSVKPSYYKIMPKTPMQLEYDSDTTTITKEIPSDIYEKNKSKYDKGVENAEFQIEVKYAEDLWEGTCIGGIVYHNMRRKPFQMRRHDAPAYILDSSYIGCLFQTVDGIRVPLQQQIENFNLQYDICEYQIMKELNRAKGKILGYDVAAIPKGKTVEKIMQEALDDGFVTYNSMAAGNIGGRNLDLQNMLQEKDLGFSDSFPQLLQLQDQILANLDRITGINEYREGSGPVSSTVTNAQQGLQNSRTITEPLFDMMQMFVEEVMVRIVEATKISWAFYKLDKGEQILGTEKFKYMQVTRELGYRDYGVHIEDGGHYARLREKMDAWIEYGLNSKQISMVDVVKYELAESTIEAENIFQDAFDKLQKIQMAQAQQEQQANAQAQQQQMQTQVQLSREDREDRQKSELEKVAAQTEGQIMIDNNKMKGKMFENQQKSDNEFLNSEGV